MITIIPQNEPQSLKALADPGLWSLLFLIVLVLKKIRGIKYPNKSEPQKYPIMINIKYLNIIFICFNSLTN